MISIFWLPPPPPFSFCPCTFIYVCTHICTRVCICLYIFMNILMHVRGCVSVINYEYGFLINYTHSRNCGMLLFLLLVTQDAKLKKKKIRRIQSNYPLWFLIYLKATTIVIIITPEENLLMQIVFFFFRFFFFFSLKKKKKNE